MHSLQLFANGNWHFTVGASSDALVLWVINPPRLPDVLKPRTINSGCSHRLFPQTLAIKAFSESSRITGAWPRFLLIYYTHFNLSLGNYPHGSARSPA